VWKPATACPEFSPTETVKKINLCCFPPLSLWEFVIHPEKVKIERKIPFLLLIKGHRN
jgi:hypothetical protein